MGWKIKYIIAHALLATGFFVLTAIIIIVVLGVFPSRPDGNASLETDAGVQSVDVYELDLTAYCDVPKRIGLWMQRFHESYVAVRMTDSEYDQVCRELEE